MERENLKELEQRLLLLRQSLDLHMQEKFQVTLQKALQDINHVCISQGANLLDLLSKVNSLQDSLSSVMVSPAVTVQISEALAGSKVAIQKARHRRILDAIRFDGMEQRYHDVSSVQERTFEWIFQLEHRFATGDEHHQADSISNLNIEDSGCDSEAEWFDCREEPFPKKMREASRDYHEWLCYDKPLFHVAGKQGKSTLMKFLFEHRQTARLLAQWAGSKKLVCASFFFWKPWNQLQRSMEGLLRAPTPFLRLVLRPYKMSSQSSGKVLSRYGT